MRYEIFYTDPLGNRQRLTTPHRQYAFNQICVLRSADCTDLELIEVGNSTDKSVRRNLQIGILN